MAIGTRQPRGYVRARGGKLEAVIVRPDGEKVRKSTGLDVGQEQEAEAVLAEALRQLQADAKPTSGARTVKGGGSVGSRTGRRARSASTSDRAHLEYFVEPQLGHLPLTSVTDVMMLDWARGLEKQRGPSGKNPSPLYDRKITLGHLERMGRPIPRPRPRFGHGAEWTPEGGPAVVGTYHPSQQNTQTGRLTPAMFDAVIRRAVELAG